MSWFWVKGWSTLSRDERKLALASSYPAMIRRAIDNTVRCQFWWDWHRWNGTAGLKL